MNIDLYYSLATKYIKIRRSKGFQRQQLGYRREQIKKLFGIDIEMQILSKEGI